MLRCHFRLTVSKMSKKTKIFAITACVRATKIQLRPEKIPSFKKRKIISSCVCARLRVCVFVCVIQGRKGKISFNNRST